MLKKTVCHDLIVPLVSCPCTQIFPGLILSDIKPAKKMKFKTVCYLLVQLMHCRKMFKAEIPFSNVMNCEDGDKVCGCLCLVFISVHIEHGSHAGQALLFAFFLISPSYLIPLIQLPCLFGV